MTQAPDPSVSLIMSEDGGSPPPAPPQPTAADAVRLKTQARRKRAMAPIMREEWADHTGARFEELEADGMEARADAILDPRNHASTPPAQGNGGEMVVESAANRRERPWLVDTVKERPSMLAADASVARLDLAAGANTLTMSVDAAESIQAANSLERMLAHQMATAHQLAMTLAARAGDFAGGIRSWDPQTRQQLQSIEAARMAAASARMMETFQRGLLTLERLRNGGKQTVVVQHVAVSEGGQAVVAGTVNQGGERK
ncbi:hypothetical protein JMJ56_16890 [Belnapia sp. T18]|uniref:Uncharacterized protein n=1 Tax=Belnapia arida TaxID=2804533 RepID=A0ABS1U4S6_9PROT|nr:hypothetical protein [Belnapia arida]MBL6079697.1 hypothetical protein [Belnapia arida]